jgi:hypothetical protein
MPGEYWYRPGSAHPWLPYSFSEPRWVSSDQKGRFGDKVAFFFSGKGEWSLLSGSCPSATIKLAITLVLLPAIMAVIAVFTKLLAYGF